MNQTAPVLVSPLSCPSCKGPVDVKSRHVAVAGSAIRVYCSADCLRASTADPPAPVPQPIAVEPPRRAIWWIAGGLVVGTTCFVAVDQLRGAPDEVAAVPVIALAELQPAIPAPSPVMEEDRQAAEDKALLGELMQDAWIHPLAGPSRRMPSNHNGAFGAERPGERPPECVSGHCGVDLGGNLWGEPIHAVHDGVIDWVNRGPNEDRGGVFVKIAHRDGTLYTWYFHLAAVPRWVRPGASVRAGQVIGLLGDTGVKHSAAHLHFSISVKPHKTARERYLDPEPLIAIWPLWIPNENQDSGRFSTVEAPGVPVRGETARRRRKGKRTRPAAEAAPALQPASVTLPPLTGAELGGEGFVQSP
jgi:murein DD-endopeptidase MepM/ murein hydrolase activator NlpD